jgi:hypothetical protein
MSGLLLVCKGFEALLTLRAVSGERKVTIPGVLDVYVCGGLCILWNIYRAVDGCTEHYSA